VIGFGSAAWQGRLRVVMRKEALPDLVILMRKSAKADLR